MFYTGAQSIRSRITLHPSRKKEDFIPQFQSTYKAKLHILLLWILPSCQESKITYNSLILELQAPAQKILQDPQQGVIQVSLATTEWAHSLMPPATDAWQSSYRRTPSISATQSSPVSCPGLSPGMPSFESGFNEMSL